MFVIKRNGQRQHISFDKILARIETLADMEPAVDRRFVDPVEIAQSVIQGLASGMTTAQLDILAAELAAYNATRHPDFGILAARIAVSNLQKQTPGTFSEAMEIMYADTSLVDGSPAPRVSDDLIATVRAHKDVLDATIRHERDFGYDYFGFKTLENGYLGKVRGKVVERPQYLHMRVALGLFGRFTGPDGVTVPEDMDSVLRAYEDYSQKFYSAASPTQYNSGTARQQMSSCFLLTVKEDSLEGIYDTLKQCALISKFAGGIGVAISKLRARGSVIKGTNGHSNGIVPWVKLFEQTARSVNQGGRRNGSIALYLEPWHADVEEFINLKRTSGAKEETIARDIFAALWVPNLLFKRAMEGKMWSLMCPHECPGLDDVHNEAFEELYTKYETLGKARRQIPATKLLADIAAIQIEGGQPYMLNKDECNRKSNQQHLGTIHCSNLCAEVVQYTNSEEVAVCNLSSMVLWRYIRDGVFDFDLFASKVKQAIRNLDAVIDRNMYPVPESRISNMKHRPVGLGVQGLHDVFLELRLPFESEEARNLNQKIFSVMHHAALSASCELAKLKGVYGSYQGSPISRGLLQPDLWGVSPEWTELRADIAKYGVRNSLLIAVMPTASTAQILGSVEACELMTSNLYTRRVLSGEFQVVNTRLIKDFVRLGVWNETVRQKIIADEGSIQNVDEIPSELKALYKTAWEVSHRAVLQQSADRAPFVCQSQSTNAYIAAPTVAKLTALMMAGYKLGLKTISYYIRTQAAAKPVAVTIDPKVIAASIRTSQNSDEALLCSLKNKEACTMCSA